MGAAKFQRLHRSSRDIQQRVALLLKTRRCCAVGDVILE